MNIIYFDNAATTKIHTEVLNEILPYLTFEYGNASSIYKLGENSKNAIENARKQVSKLINAEDDEIYFTGSGSESDNLAIKGYAYANKNKGNHIITSKIEHPAVLETCKNLEKNGFKISYISVNNEGIINVEELKKEINSNTILISIMFANNEIGTIQPIEEIASIAKKHNIVFHTDAVQAVGNVYIDVKKMGIDMLSLSGHKINAPKGIGALYIKKGINIDRIIDGGNQEKGKRAGTENVAGIVGLGKASEISNKNIKKHIIYTTKLRDYYFKKVTDEFKGNVIINGSVIKRLPGNTNVSFKGIRGKELAYKLGLRNICVSSGSACSSCNLKPSHVLEAIKIPKDFESGSIRATFGDNNTFQEIDYLIKVLKNILK